MDKQRFISVLSLCACFFAIGVIALGALTRLIDAGLGCPDWPGCYGQFTVPTTQVARSLANLQFPTTPLVSYKAWAEMIHRYFVGGLSIFIFSIIFFIIQLYRNKKWQMSNLCLASLLFVLLIYQIILGQWTVTLKLIPFIVTQHLLGGFLILATLWLIYLNNKNLPPNLVATKKRLPYKKFFGWGIFILSILFLQITLGAWTSTNYAALSCPDFPFCANDQTQAVDLAAFKIFTPIGINYDGGILSIAARQTIQMVHRLGALIFTCALFIYVAFMLRYFKNNTELLKSIYIILGLVCVQICIGISNVIFKLPLFTAILHTLTAALLLLAMLTLLFKLNFFNRKAALS